jgi:hypothetical protein
MIYGTADGIHMGSSNNESENYYDSQELANFEELIFSKVNKL